MKEKKNLDLKSWLTILISVSLVIFVGILLFKTETTPEISIMFYSAFILFANQMAQYYFNRKKDGE